MQSPGVLGGSGGSGVPGYKSKSRYKSSATAPTAPTAPQALNYYILSVTERAQNEYPLDYREEREKDNDGRWTTTPPSARGHAAVARSLVAIDCEMVVTSVGSELARLTAVDENHSVLLDLLVKPEHPVLDYKTRFSGITEPLLRRVTTTLEDARARLFDFITADTILVGHSLENDLKVLKLQHDRVIDSSVVYPRAPGPPQKHGLCFLARYVLHRKIQNRDGHDSAEDARAALELVQLKIARGAQFGFEYISG